MPRNRTAKFADQQELTHSVRACNSLRNGGSTEKLANTEHSCWVQSWAAAPLSPGNLTRIRDLGKKSGSSRGKITTISIDDFELLFQDCLVFRPTLFTILRSSSILFPPVVR